jgi:hypothetical protein
MAQYRPQLLYVVIYLHAQPRAAPIWISGSRSGNPHHRISHATLVGSLRDMRAYALFPHHSSTRDSSIATALQYDFLPVWP